MAGATARLPMSHHRILTFDNCEIDFSGEAAMSLSDTVFGFLDFEGSSPESVASIEEYDENGGGDGEEGRCECVGEDNKNFWENQHQLLHATLSRTSSLEAKIRNATQEALKEVQIGGNACVCRTPVAGSCRNCLMREVCGRLQNAGYDSAICKSKWKSSPDIPSGEHTFLDVVDKSNPKKGEIRVIIELNFRAEFEMARASEEYNKLITSLPELFIGKVERLHSLLKIVCSAAKKCMKEKKIHIGPWRKHRYMQAKWLGTCQRTTSTTPPLPTGYSGRPPRPRASMLTQDLLDNLPNLHRTVVEVV